MRPGVEDASTRDFPVTSARCIRILTVVGARPQFIKAAALSRAIGLCTPRGGPQLVEEILHTGQHYDAGMSQVFFDELDIPRPVVNLDVGSGPQGATTAAMLAGIEREVTLRQPTLVLVYGDTNSTLAGALAAVKLHVPVAHVEAGLRSFDRRMAEEHNRVLTDHAADLLLAPSALACENLRREGIERGVHCVGDVMLDAIRYYTARIQPEASPEPFALATVHRAQNTDDPERLAAIVQGLARCPIPVILPLHPRTQKALAQQQIIPGGSIRTCAPLSYLESITHLMRCRIVLTDSGGLQKEAYFLGKPCVTLRDRTEWRELVDLGFQVLADADAERIRAGIAWALSVPPVPPPLTTPYGSGDAAGKIIDVLLRTFA